MKAPVPPSPAAAALDAALAHHQAGRLPAALAAYRALRARGLREARLFHLGGLALLQSGQPGDAAEWLELATRLDPRSAASATCLGVALGRLHRLDEAVRHLRQATVLDPAHGEAWTNLGLTLARLRPDDEAFAALRRGAELRPREPSAHLAWGRALQANARLLEALDALAPLAALRGPEGAAASSVRAAALHGLGRMPEALAAYDRALALDPTQLEAASQRLLVLHYLDEVNASDLAAAHRDFGRALRRALGPPAPLPPRTRPALPVRIGFLSPDLRDHAVARFLEPLLPGIAAEGIAIFLYHNHPREDEVSARMRRHARLWRNVAALTDEATAATLRGDELDAVIDLAGHTGHSRPGVLARRVAPVQISYLGYPNGTGIDTIDHRFTDALADPPALDAAHPLEPAVRFSSCAWCYQAPPDLPDLPPPPAALDPARPVVFASFNHLGKISPATWALWARVLHAVPGSTLVLKGTPPDPQWATRSATAAGLDPARVCLLPFAPTRIAHFAAYAEVDITLDPLPYHGTTTTCEALWLGRPVITLAGDRHVRRVGASLLTAAGAPDWIATDTEGYVAAAVRLATDRAELGRRSAALRATLPGSPLGDAANQGRAFARAVLACLTARP